MVRFFRGNAELREVEFTELYTNLISDLSNLNIPPVDFTHIQTTWNALINGEGLPAMVIALEEVKTAGKQKICKDLKASLSFHPNVMLDEDFQEEQHRRHLDSLADLVYNYGALPEEIAIEVITRVAHVLSNLHSFRLPMRSALDASNIYLDEAGEVRFRIPNEVFENGVCQSTDEWFETSNVFPNSIPESEQQTIERDIRSLGALFSFCLFGQDATALPELELRQLDNTWDDDQKASCNTTALKTLVLRMIRAGFAGGYQDMQTVVIDLWELGIVSFPHNK